MMLMHPMQASMNLKILVAGDMNYARLYRVNEVWIFPGKVRNQAPT